MAGGDVDDEDAPLHGGDLHAEVPAGGEVIGDELPDGLLHVLHASDATGRPVAFVAVSPAPLPVFVNPAARKGRSAGAVRRGLAALEAFGASPQVVPTPDVAAVRAAATRCAADGVERVVAFGGDGIVHQVLQGIAGSGTALGIVPVGSGNDLARALRLPLRPVDAARVALADPVALDALRVDGTWVATVATTGFAAAVNTRATAMRFPRGQARYSVATFAELARVRAVPVRLGLDDAPPITVPAVLVAVGNTTQFGGGMRVCPDASPTDGLADVTVIGDVGPVTLARTFPRIFSGSHVRHRKVQTFRARTVRIEVEGDVVGVHGDGEVVGPLPATVTTVPGAWRVAGARTV